MEKFCSTIPEVQALSPEGSKEVFVSLQHIVRVGSKHARKILLQESMMVTL